MLVVAMDIDMMTYRSSIVGAYGACTDLCETSSRAELEERLVSGSSDASFEVAQRTVQSNPQGDRCWRAMASTL
jgi:hypothetical protein